MSEWVHKLMNECVSECEKKIFNRTRLEVCECMGQKMK